MDTQIFILSRWLSRCKIEEFKVLQNFKFASFCKVVIYMYVYRYQAIDIHCIDFYRPQQSLLQKHLLALINFSFIIVQEITLIRFLKRIEVISWTIVIIALKSYYHNINYQSINSIHINYHFLQGGTTAEKVIRNPLFWISLCEWNFIKPYFPDTRTVFPVMWPQYLPNTWFSSLVICT